MWRGSPPTIAGSDIGARGRIDAATATRRSRDGSMRPEPTVG